MCRNPSCQNFGIHYEGATATGNKTVNDDCYRHDSKLVYLLQAAGGAAALGVVSIASYIMV